MSEIRVHNITDRVNTPGVPRAIVVGPDKIRPGKSQLVNEELLNQKFRRLHGVAVWIGEHLPTRYTRTSTSAVKARRRGEAGRSDAMDLAEAREHLAALSRDALLDLCMHIVPPLEFNKQPSHRALVSRLGRALFSSGRDVDPEKFFWLRRWVRVGDTFIEKE